MAATWELPSVVREALGNIRTLNRGNPSCVANVVRMANALVETEQTEFGADDPPEDVARHVAADGALLLRLDAAALRSLHRDFRATVMNRLPI